MTRKNILMILPIMFSILLIPNFVMIYANHDDPTGGVCSGDCTAPTMGVNNIGMRHVENGFSINDKSIDVEYFKQYVETQTINVGEQVEITLKVFEDSGDRAQLQHVGLLLGVESVFTGSTWIDSHPAEIHWDQSFDEIQSVTVVENTDNLITDVNVKVDVDENLTILKFQFTPTTSFDTSKIIVQMWDQKRNAWTNTFFDALEIISENEHNFVIHDETHEEESHETHEEFQCLAGLEKVLRVSSLTPVCVTSYTASVLIDYSWAVPAQ